jgi:pyrrolidone-carboxylate peptidase
MNMIPLLQALIQYSAPEFSEIERRILALNGNEFQTPDNNGKKSKKEEAIEQSILHAYQLAKAVPAANNYNLRLDIGIDGLKAAKIPATFDDSSGKVVKALSAIALEFYHGNLGGESLTNRVLFQHFTGKSLDVIK